MKVNNDTIEINGDEFIEYSTTREIDPISEKKARKMLEVINEVSKIMIDFIKYKKCST